MLLQDESIERNFGVILRVAQLLQQAAISNGNPHMSYGLGAARDVGLAASPSAAVSFASKAHSSLSAVGETQMTAVSRAPSANSAGSKSEDYFLLERPLNLPRVNTDESLTPLRQLGRLLEDSLQQLQASVDAQLVDFYSHLKKSSTVDLLARTAHKGPANDFPSGQLMTTSTVLSASRQVRQKADLTDSWSQLDDDRSGVSFFGPTEHRAGMLPVIDAGETCTPGSGTAAGVPTFVSGTPGVGAVRTRGSPTEPTSNPTLHSIHSKHSRSLTRSVVGSSLGLKNGFKARSIEEERAAALELQSFFALLLEAAVQLSGASAAAVYMDDAVDPTVATASTVGSGRARFLHCVAHLNGCFPSGISYAVSSLLTTVTITGVAANVHYSPNSLLPVGTAGCSDTGVTSTRSFPVLDGGTSRPEIPRGSPQKNGKHADRAPLDMYNGVVVPIKGIGCVVLANKEMVPGTHGPVSHFSLFDEHIAWSVALMCESVLRRYERQVLLRVGWSSSCTSALRPYLLQGGPSRGIERPSNAPRSGSARRNRKSAQKRLNSKVAFTPSAGSTKLSASDVDGAAVSSLIFDPQNDIFSKRLTMVRTADPQVLRVLPSRPQNSLSQDSPQVRNILNTVAAEAAKSTPSKVLSDEAVFQAAAEYITNLESLLRRTISESNTMHSLVEKYNKSMRHQEETIALLEAKVRELQTQMVYLQRRNHTAHLSAF